MELSLFIKKPLAHPLAYFLSIQGKLCNNPGNKYVIIMYHRIIYKDETEGIIQDGMYTNPDTFKNQIKYLKDNFNIVSLQYLASVLSTKYLTVDKKPFCCITFDDGWKDFYKYAYPILISLNTCATVFLPTDFIGTSKLFWTDRLSSVLQKIYQLKNEGIKLMLSSNTYINRIESISGSINSRIDKAAETLKSLNMDDIEFVLQYLAKRWNVDYKIQSDSFLSWDEVKAMYKSGIIFFGSHTKSHRILTTIPDERIQEELIQSKSKLLVENIVNPKFIPFAYPNGNYNDRIAKMVKEAGYNLAVTTEKGWNSVKIANGDLYKLKRIGIHEDMTSTNAMLACRIYGIY